MPINTWHYLSRLSRLFSSSSGPGDHEGLWCIWNPRTSSPVETLRGRPGSDTLHYIFRVDVPHAHISLDPFNMARSVRRIALALLYSGETRRWRRPPPLRGWAGIHCSIFVGPGDFGGALFPWVLTVAHAVDDDVPLCKWGGWRLTEAD